MNYISCIIQILEIPKIKLYENNLPMVIFRTKLPSIRNKTNSVTIVTSVIWGNLANDLINYYRVNDYILIEGYPLILSNGLSNQIEIQLNISRLYPFLFTIEKGNQI